MTKKRDKCGVCKKVIGVNVPYVYREGAVVHEKCCKVFPKLADVVLLDHSTTTGTTAANITLHISPGANKKVEDVEGPTSHTLSPGMIPMLKKEVGRKDDHGKPRPDLLPPRALLGVSAVLAHGAEKYGVDNWQKVENARARYTAALFRH